MAVARPACAVETDTARSSTFSHGEIDDSHSGFGGLRFRTFEEAAEVKFDQKRRVNNTIGNNLNSGLGYYSKMQNKFPTQRWTQFVWAFPFNSILFLLHLNCVCRCLHSATWEWIILVKNVAQFPFCSIVDRQLAGLHNCFLILKPRKRCSEESQQLVNSAIERSSFRTNE